MGGRGKFKKIDAFLEPNTKHEPTSRTRRLWTRNHRKSENVQNRRLTRTNDKIKRNRRESVTTKDHSAGYKGPGKALQIPIFAETEQPPSYHFQVDYEIFHYIPLIRKFTQRQPCVPTSTVKVLKRTLTRFRTRKYFFFFPKHCVLSFPLDKFINALL